MEVVVEIIEPGQRKPRIERLSSERFTVGRGWNCDVLIQDDEIDALHLEAVFDEETRGFLVSDKNTLNGSRVGKNPLDSAQEVTGNDWIHIGRSRIRLHDALAPVNAARKRTPLDSLAARLQSNWLAISLMIAALLVTEYSSYNSRATIVESEEVISSLLQTLSALVVWSIVWGGIARLTKHEFQIWLHLSLASTFILLSSLLTEITQAISFNLLSPLWNSWSSTLLIVGLGASWLAICLYMGTNLKIRARSAIVSAVAVFYLLTTQILPQMRSDSWVATTDLVTVSRPSSWLLTNGASKDQYLLKISETFRKAEKAAIEVNSENDQGAD